MGPRDASHVPVPGQGWWHPPTAVLGRPSWAQPRVVTEGILRMRSEVCTPGNARVRTALRPRPGNSHQTLPDHGLHYWGSPDCGCSSPAQAAYSSLYAATGPSRALYPGGGTHPRLLCPHAVSKQ